MRTFSHPAMSSGNLLGVRSSLGLGQHILLQTLCSKPTLSHMECYKPYVQNKPYVKNRPLCWKFRMPQNTRKMLEEAGYKHQNPPATGAPVEVKPPVMNRRDLAPPPPANPPWSHRIPQNTWKMLEEAGYKHQNPPATGAPVNVKHLF